MGRLVVWFKATKFYLNVNTPRVLARGFNIFKKMNNLLKVSS